VLIVPTLVFEPSCVSVDGPKPELELVFRVMTSTRELINPVEAAKSGSSVVGQIPTEDSTPVGPPPAGAVTFDPVPRPRASLS
jgi:hypothetical protein